MSEPSALELAQQIEKYIRGDLRLAIGAYCARNAEALVAALRAAPAQEPVAASGPVMKALVDWTYLHATDGEQWPSSKTTLGLIAKALAASPTQSDADAMKAAAPAQEPVAEPTDVMVKAGLLALVAEIERLGGAPNSQPNDAQKYMQLGSLIRCGSEVKAAYKAMVAAAPPADAKAAPDDDRMQEDMTLAHNARMAARKEAADLVKALEEALKEHDYRRDMAYRTSDMLWAVSARAALAAWKARGNE